MSDVGPVKRQPSSADGKVLSEGTDMPMAARFSRQSKWSLRLTKFCIRKGAVAGSGSRSASRRCVSVRLAAAAASMLRIASTYGVKRSAYGTGAMSTTTRLPTEAGLVNASAIAVLPPMLCPTTVGLDRLCRAIKVRTSSAISR